MNIILKICSASVASLILFLASGCSSSSDDDVARPPAEIPGFALPSITNGFYLSAESLSFNNDVVLSTEVYVLDSEQKTLSRFRENSSGEIQFDVSHEFNDDGLITAKMNLDGSGVALQTFVKTYDDLNRLTSERSFNELNPFLNTDYQFTESGAVSRKVVTSSLSGNPFSQTDYQYDNSGVLLTSRLTSPLLTQPIEIRYFFNLDGTRLESILEDNGDRSNFEYDVNGNVLSQMRTNSEGRLLSTTTYEYTATDLVVPNLPLFEMVYEFDQL